MIRIVFSPSCLKQCLFVICKATGVEESLFSCACTCRVVPKWKMSISPWIFLSLVCFILAKEVEQHIGIYCSPYESPHGTDIVIR